MDERNEARKIDEAALEQVSGGWSENRYDPNVCGKLTAPRSECRNAMLTENVALFTRWCDHYRESETWTEIVSGYERKFKTFSCVMKGFPEFTKIVM